MAESLVAAANYTRLAPLRVRGVRHDHPWDGEQNRPAREKPNLHMGKRILTIFLAIFLLLSFSNVQAQTRLIVVDPDEDTGVRSKNDLEAAEEYEDFIARLQKLAYDYQGYFAKFEEYYAIKYQALLQKLVLKVNEGKFCGEPEVLLEEIQYIMKVLHDQQDEIKTEVGNYKLYRLSRNLQRNLEVLSDELHEELMVDMESDLIRDQISQYMQLEWQESEEARKIYEQTLKDHEKLVKAVEEAVEAAMEYEKAALTEKQLRALEKLAELEEELADWKLLELDSEKFLVVPPTAPDPGEIPHPAPPPPAPPLPKERTVVIKPGMVMSYKEYFDSLEVKSDDLPIFINSETGDLRVTGWSKDRVVVKFKVEIAAESEISAESFAKDINIKLSANEKGVYVKAHFPSLSDPKRKILASAFDVRVPAGNAVISENSFGTVIISDLKKGLRLNTNYCDVHLDHIKGEIEAASKMNVLAVSNSSGKFKLSNSMGPIQVHECVGEFDLQNSYSPVELSNCEGPVFISNSGHVTVNEHSGTITIDNTNGPVELADVIGDLDVKNSYKPVIVSDIRGSVNLQNMSGTIELSDISGQAVVSNRYGSIVSRYVSGPIQIDNEAGTTHLAVYDALAGPSFIVSKAGTVRLDLGNESDILLTVKSEGGSIIGSKGNPIRKDGYTSSLQMTYGKGSTPLEVTATQSTVVIDESNDI
jgi:tetratricopeptide (TPR) repeat protein